MSSAVVLQNTFPEAAAAAALSISSIDENNLDSYSTLPSPDLTASKSRHKTHTSSPKATRSPTSNPNATHAIILQKGNSSTGNTHSPIVKQSNHQSSHRSENHHHNGHLHASLPSPTVGPGAGVPVPPRSSSQYRTSTRESSPLLVDSHNMEPAPAVTATSPSATATAAARRRTQQTSEHLNPPVAGESSNEKYTIHVSDPAEDAARMEARMQEARGQAPTVSTPQGATGQEGDEATRSAGAKSSSKRDGGSKRREHKLGSYILGQTLGEGEFGKVKLGWRKDDGMQVAIKIIRKESLTNNAGREQKIAREIKILRTLNHPNIVRLHDIVNDERYIGLALEYASGGELFDYILHNRYLKDHSARRLFAQLISGVGYLHKKGIVHRDLKLENLLLDKNRNIIITDFGFANEFNPDDDLSLEIIDNIKNKDFVTLRGLDQMDVNGRRRGDLMQTSCGSPCYAAPELVVTDSLYTGRKVDVWSCGVILVSFLILLMKILTGLVCHVGWIPAF
jgi:protein-serine/threonine kinase